MNENIALIPIYKPDAGFISLVKKIQKQGFIVLAINDGSGKEYDSIFEQAKQYATIVEHAQNQGKGEALKTGLRYIQKEFSTPYFIVCADGDGQHAIEDMHKVIELSKKYPRSLILGSRSFVGNVPLKSRIGNRLTSLVFQMSSGRYLIDTQTGLRAFSQELIPSLLSIEGSRYEYEMNVLMEFVRNNIEIVEQPIETIYLNENKSSHFHMVKDSYRIYKEILKFSFPSIARFIIDCLLFILFIQVGCSLLFSNVLAQIWSQTVFFFLNKEKKNLMKFILVSTGILVCDTILISLLVHIGTSCWIAKLCIEVLFIFFRKGRVCQKKF